MRRRSRHPRPAPSTALRLRDFVSGASGASGTQNWDLAFAKARRVKDAVGIAALVAFALALVFVLFALRRAGFSHVSDDDFARTVIAQEWVASLRGYRFVHELPAFREARWVRVVDPSGTSWLPFPFWTTGAAMMLFGRSIEVARAAQLAMLAGATIVLGRALHRARFDWLTVAFVLALGFANPYALWLGASQAPDAWVAVLLAAALVALVEEKPDRVAALALLAATLGRYEAWPVAAVFAGRYLLRRVSTPAARRPLRAAVPLLGPLAWTAWNWLAHGSPLHFFARVSAYRSAHEALSLSERALAVPRASVELLDVGLSVVVLTSVVLILWAPATRRRWGATLLGLGALLGFLVVGSLGNGAPTHHAARAQLAVSFVGAALLVVGSSEAMRRAQVRWGSAAGAVLVSAACFAVVVWGAGVHERLRDHPGRGDADRAREIARGEELVETSPAGITLTPCQYEYLATMAAYEAPERALVTGSPTGCGSRR